MERLFSPLDIRKIFGVRCREIPECFPPLGLRMETIGGARVLGRAPLRDGLRLARWGIDFGSAMATAGGSLSPGMESPGGNCGCRASRERWWASIRESS